MACSSNFVSSVHGVPPQGLSQATLTFDEKTNEVEITNHEQRSFRIDLDMMVTLGRQFDELCRSLPFITRRFHSRETVNEDIHAVSIGALTEHTELRLVARKKNRMVYLSCGVYEKSRFNNQYFYCKDMTFRIDYFSDDINGVVELFLARRDELMGGKQQQQQQQHQGAME